jgi:hypothetical protein
LSILRQHKISEFRQLKSSSHKNLKLAAAAPAKTSGVSASVTQDHIQMSYVQCSSFHNCKHRKMSLLAVQISHYFSQRQTIRLVTVGSFVCTVHTFDKSNRDIKNS